MPSLNSLEWQAVPSTLRGDNGKDESVMVYRAKVPGGWFVKVYFEGVSSFFYPDPEHQWDGKSMA